MEQCRITLKWLSEEQMLEVEEPDETRQVFVISNFDDNDPIFQHLHELKHMCWGPSVISYCSSKELPLPDKPREVYSMAFRDVSVSLTGLSQKQKVCKLIQYSFEHFILGISRPQNPIDGRNR